MPTATCVFEPVDVERAAGLDLVFLGLPHGASQDLVPEPAAPGQAHRRPRRRLPPEGPRALPAAGTARPTAAPNCSTSSSTACPSSSGPTTTGRRWSPSPGCYVTTAALTLAPLVHGGLVEPAGIIVDAASGVSGAGRPPKANTTFCTVDEDFTAYGLLDHRHTPEIEQAIAAARPRRAGASRSRCCSRRTWRR